MPSTKKITVFYTDDDEEDLEFFKDVTETIGTKVELVTHLSGQNLLDALHNPPPNPHLLFLDLNMPGLNGFDVLTAMRNDDSLKSLPVIIFSTSQDEQVIDQSRTLGANYFVPKSGSFPAMKKSIEHAISIDWEHFTPSKENFVYSA